MTIRHPPTKLPTLATPGSPWWRHRFVWLVMGLPATAVVAATTSAVIAIRHADPVVDEYRARAKQAAEESIERDASRTAKEPAELARNHAATPNR